MEHRSMDSTVFHSAQSVAQLLDLSTHETSAPDLSLGSTGLAVLKATRLNTFTVMGYKGDPTHSYFSAQVHLQIQCTWYYSSQIQISDFSLLHCGCVTEAYSCVLESSDNNSVLTSLLPVVYHSPVKASHQGYEQDPMLAIAVEMRLNEERNSRTNKCSLALSNTTVQYHMTTPEHNCFKQVQHACTCW